MILQACMASAPAVRQQPPRVDGMESIHVLLRRDRLQQPRVSTCFGSGSWIRMPSTSSRAFRSAISASNSSVVTLSGGVSISLRMPSSPDVFTLLRT